ncbi:MAG: DUF58 domain-containing protein [SAR202 cluster bacterium]|nr:DUF58 domain-containing protein [SAR202 cluster bacterium]
MIAFGFMGVAAAGISWAWNRSALYGLIYERKFSDPRIFLGDTLEMDLLLTNKKIVPLSWVKIEDIVPEGVKIVEASKINDAPAWDLRYLRHTTAVAWYERIRWRYKLKFRRRGIYSIGPANIESGDPFGFLKSKNLTSPPVEVVVYPRVYPLIELGIPPARPLGEIKGGNRIFPDPSRLAGIRDYVIGDPIKTIDWKATSKLSKLMVRTYEPSSTYTVVICLQTDMVKPHWQSYDAVQLERVISAAASVAKYSAEKQYSVGLFCNDMPIVAGKPMTVSPTNDPENLTQVLSALAVIRTFSIGPMYEVLIDYSRRFPFGATIVLVSAFLPEEMALTLTDLKARDYKPVVVYVGNEPCPPLPNGIILHDIAAYFKQREAADAADQA